MKQIIKRLNIIIQYQSINNKQIILKKQNKIIHIYNNKQHNYNKLINNYKIKFKTKINKLLNKMIQ